MSFEVTPQGLMLTLVHSSSGPEVKHSDAGGILYQFNSILFVQYLYDIAQYLYDILIGMMLSLNARAIEMTLFHILLRQIELDL